ncbi:MAG: LysR family transcriptional regulator [Pseudomonadota bacterium]
MNLRDLKYVEAVAKYRNFSRAADATNVSQPALSSQIRKLEQELGSDLFDRKPGDVQLTKFGERVVDAVRQINLLADGIREAAMEFRDVEAVPLRLGMTPTLAPYLTQYFIEMLSGIYPSLRVVIIEDKPAQLAEMVERQDIDCALLAWRTHQALYDADDEDALNFISLWFEPLYLAARNDHPVLTGATIRAKDVPGDYLIRFKVPFGYELEADLPVTTPEVAEALGFDLDRARFETVCRNLQFSDACTLVNAIASNQFTREGLGLKYMEFEDNGNLRELGVVHRKNYPRASIIASIKTYINEFPPAGVRPASET